MATTKSQTKFATQITYDTSTGTGSYADFSAALAHNAAIVLFNNTSTVTVTISDDGVNDGLTLAAGQGASFDLRTNASKPAPDFSWSIATQFECKCAAGTGLVYISYVYAL